MATNRKRTLAALQPTPWDKLTFKLHFGWQDTDSAFRTDDGRPGTIQFKRENPDGTGRLLIDFDKSDIGKGWERAVFEFVPGNTLTLGHKFPEWTESAQVGAAWALKGEEIIKMVKDSSLNLAHIEGLFEGQFRVLGIYLPRSVEQSHGRLTDLFLFTIVFGSSPDGGATGPPPNP